MILSVEKSPSFKYKTGRDIWNTWNQDIKWKKNAQLKDELERIILVFIKAARLMDEIKLGKQQIQSIAD